jgi:hypothetical protein
VAIHGPRFDSRAHTRYPPKMTTSHLKNTIFQPFLRPRTLPPPLICFTLHIYGCVVGVGANLFMVCVFLLSRTVQLNILRPPLSRFVEDGAEFVRSHARLPPTLSLVLALLVYLSPFLKRT